MQPIVNLLFADHVVKFNCYCNCPVIIAESSVRGQHFKHLVEYALAVCRECQHSVLPSYIKSYVQQAYLAKQKQAKAIAEEVGN
jgi:predicted nucleic acid-binding Zn finger protein